MNTDSPTRPTQTAKRTTVAVEYAITVHKQSGRKAEAAPRDFESDARRYAADLVEKPTIEKAVVREVRREVEDESV